MFCFVYYQNLMVETIHAHESVDFNLILNEMNEKKILKKLH
jgi:hypothetical protein